MKRNLAVTILLLVAGLVTSLYFWNSAWLELGELKLELAKQHAETSQLKKDLKARESEIDSLKAQVSDDEGRIRNLSSQAQTQSKDLQALDAELAAQRARVEEKRKQYEAMKSNTGADAFAAAKIKNLNDEIQTLEQQRRSVEQDIANAGYEASTARQGRKQDAQYAVAQARSQVQATQDMIRTLQAQRGSIPQGRGASVDSRQQIQDLNVRISAAQAQLNAMKGSESQVQVDQKNQTQNLESQIKRSIDGLHHDQGDIRGKIEAKKADLFKLQQHGIAATSFQKERADLLAKLTGELKEEIDKLKILEAKVQSQKAKSDAMSPSAAAMPAAHGTPPPGRN
jgi:predicted  nucleic acid-binding Zn-ribbon protein